MVGPRSSGCLAPNRRVAVAGHYEAEASCLASARKIARVHLDAIWWGERSNADEA